MQLLTGRRGSQGAIQPVANPRHFPVGQSKSGPRVADALLQMASRARTHRPRRPVHAWLRGVGTGTPDEAVQPPGHHGVALSCRPIALMEICSATSLCLWRCGQVWLGFEGTPCKIRSPQNPLQRGGASRPQPKAAGCSPSCPWSHSTGSQRACNTCHLLCARPSSAAHGSCRCDAPAILSAPAARGSHTPAPKEDRLPDDGRTHSTEGPSRPSLRAIRMCHSWPSWPGRLYNRNIPIEAALQELRRWFLAVANHVTPRPQLSACALSAVALLRPLVTIHPMAFSAVVCQCGGAPHV